MAHPAFVSWKTPDDERALPADLLHKGICEGAWLASPSSTYTGHSRHCDCATWHETFSVGTPVAGRVRERIPRER